MIFDFPFIRTGVQKNLHLIVLLETEEESYLNGLLDQYPALYRNAEMCWSLPVEDDRQVTENIEGLCKLMDSSDINMPAYAAEALFQVPRWHRSPLRLLQFVKTFTGVHEKTTLSINSRCNVLQVSAVVLFVDDG